jgi:hypothetical protein
MHADAAVGGAAGGALLFTTFNPALAGAASAAAGNLTQQATQAAINAVSGNPVASFDTGSLAEQTIIGAVAGPIAARAIGPVANEFTPLAQQMMTKLENGTIQSMQDLTAVKVVTGEVGNMARDMAAEGLAEAVANNAIETAK